MDWLPLQVDLGQVKTVTGVATQGDPSSDKWVKTYFISYSYDSLSWLNYKLEFKQNDVYGKVFIECWFEYEVQYEALPEVIKVYMNYKILFCQKLA